MYCPIITIKKFKKRNKTASKEGIRMRDPLIYTFRIPIKALTKGYSIYAVEHDTDTCRPSTASDSVISYEVGS